MSAARAKLDALDGLRGVAAFFVVLHHMATNRLLPSNPLLIHGSMLVDTFFVISGFVLAYQYADRIHAVSDIPMFLRRRVARIWPLHAAILMAMMLPRAAGVLLHGPENSPLFDPTSHHSLGAWFASLTMLHAMGLYDHGVWNGPSWTLSVEFFTYMLFALVAMYGARGLRVAAMLFVVGALFSMVLLGSYMAVPVQYSFLRCVAGFFLGVLLLTPYQAFERALPRGAIIATLGEAISFAVCIVLLFLGPRSAWSLMFPFACSSLVLLLAVPRGAFAATLSRQPFQAIGTWSLGIYLLHVPLLNTLWSLQVPMSHIGLRFDAQWGGRESIIFLVLTIVLAAAGHRFLERPARNLLSGLRARKPSLTPPVAILSAVNRELP